MKFDNVIESRLQESLSVKEKMYRSPDLLKSINEVVEIILTCYREHSGRVFFAGNGGSASDAQHLAAELVGRYYLDRKALDSEAITTNSSTVTAIGNDFGYDKIFERAVEGKGREGDVFIGISTSGNSKNIVKALTKCKEMNIKTVGFTGEKAGLMDTLCDVVIKIPSKDTPRIQEGHILAGHIICEIVEKEMFPDV